jgi:hypothetical protein
MYASRIPGGHVLQNDVRVDERERAMRADQLLERLAKGDVAQLPRCGLRSCFRRIPAATSTPTT